MSPRIRTIKPEFWTDSIMVQLPHQARLFFIGLWSMADDHGWLPDEPERLRLQILPAEKADTSSLVDLLVAAGRLEQHEFQDGERWLYIPAWKKHQRVDHPSPSRKPTTPSRKLAIPQEVRRAVATKYGCRPGGQKKAACYYCGATGHIYWMRLSDGRPSSWVYFSLELDHCEPESAAGQAVTENIVLACRTCNRSKGTRSFADVLGGLANFREPSRLNGREKEEEEEIQTTEWRKTFELAWSSYPKRPGNPKEKAWKAWQARLKEGVTAEALFNGVTKYGAMCRREKTEPRFIKMAATFFGPDKHWETDYTPVGSAKPPETRHSPAYHEKYKPPDVTETDPRVLGLVKQVGRPA